MRPKHAPLIALLCAALALAGFETGCTRRPARVYEHVILVSIDTLRADQVGCYGNPRVKTPTLDALAAEGVLFEQVMTAAPTTLASHTSIMTGTYPHTHGVVRNGFVVAQDNVMLAEVLHDAGYRTAAFLGSFALDRRFAFKQGFEVFDQQFDVGIDGTHEQEQRSAAAVTDAALQWAAGLGSEPFFLFAHYFDVHAPYEPPAPFDAMYARPNAPKRATLGAIDHAVRAQQLRATGKERGVQDTIVHGLDAPLLDGADGRASPEDEDLAALYDGEVSYADRELGRLLAGLEARGMLANSLVVVVSDHGETFAEHGDFWNHGLWVHQTTVHVPVIVRARGDTKSKIAPRRVAEPVSTVDLVPTIAELVGVPIPARVEGTSLVPWLRGETRTRGPIFCEATQPPIVERKDEWGNAAKAKCVRSGRFKYVFAPYLAREELFDLERDPAERVNLLARGAAPLTGDAAAQLPGLRTTLEAWARGAHPLPSRFDPTQTIETMRRLGEIGYAEGDGGGEGSGGTRPDAGTTTAQPPVDPHDAADPKPPR